MQCGGLCDMGGDRVKQLSLFSGIEGIGVACEWAGITPAAFCERDDYCQKVLKRHWPGVPIYDDVCTLTRERLEEDGIDCSTIGLVSSGDPCQPSSYAGNREGDGDDRHLWPQTNRIIKEIGPNWVVRENVAGNITMGLDEVLSNLDDLGYTSQSFVIPASAVYADHERYRVFTIGYAHRLTKSQENTLSNTIRANWVAWETAAGEHRRKASEFNRPVHQPPVCRVDDGLPDRSYKGRMKALGNAVDPFQIYPIIAGIKFIDDMLH
jgi:DNA (cytosine-5)-methyltransferase 1